MDHSQNAPENMAGSQGSAVPTADSDPTSYYALLKDYSYFDFSTIKSVVVAVILIFLCKEIPCTHLLSSFEMYENEKESEAIA